MKPAQYAVTFSLLPTIDSSSQKKGSWPVVFAPIAAYTRYNAADPILTNKWVGTGCGKGQSFCWKISRESTPTSGRLMLFRMMDSITTSIAGKT